MKKTRLFKLLPLIFTTALTACNSQPAQKDTFTVGVCQLVSHVALDAATKGFTDTLKEEFGDKVDIKFQNATGDSAICSTIVNDFVSKNVDLIMANATPALQAASQSTEKIPVLGTSITEYGVALDIDDFTGVTGFNVSGTSDLAPLDEQAQMVKDLFPEAKNVGILYCSSEANSKYQVEVVSKKLQEFNLQVTEMKFTDSNDIAAIMNGKISSIDVLYIPTDNKAADNTEIIDDICTKNNVPVFAGEEGICVGCGVFTLSINYYNIGVKTGQMAIEILKNGADITKMAIAYDEHPVKKYNAAKCEALGIVPPEGFVAIE